LCWTPKLWILSSLWSSALLSLEIQQQLDRVNDDYIDLTQIMYATLDQTEFLLCLMDYGSWSLHSSLSRIWTAKPEVLALNVGQYKGFVRVQVREMLKDINGCPLLVCVVRMFNVMNHPGSTFSHNTSVQIQTCLSGTGLSWCHHMTFSRLKPDHRF
jgi:hypothetical protein